jgi:cytochrome P450
VAFFHHIAERPEHVPEEAVFDFDYHRDPGLFVDPHERVLALTREAPPLFWTPHNGGHWMALSYDLTFRIMREYETFSSSLFSADMIAAMTRMREAQGIHENTQKPRPSLILIDPPEHTRLRAPLQKTFSPKTVIKLKGDIEDLARELVEAVAPLGACDFLSAVIEQLPVRIFLRMMGLPEDRLQEYRALVREAFEPHDGDYAKRAGHGQRIQQVMLPTILDRRDNPREDIISMLWTVEIEGEEMTLELMQEYCGLLFLAGLDTVINAMAHGTRHLAADPAMQAEELLRRYTITAPIRRAKHDVELGGRVIKEDDLIVTYLSAADLDPAAFPQPEKADLDRENKNHLIFGAGPHRCLGSHLARIELQTYYQVLLEMLPEFRLDPDHRPVFHGGNMLAVSYLPLRWD